MNIYIVHSILPSYHTTAEKALKRAWATCGLSTAGLSDEAVWDVHVKRQHYIDTGKQTLRNPTIDTYRPLGELIGLPKVTRATVE